LLSLFEANPNWEQFVDPHEILKKSPKKIKEKQILSRWHIELEAENTALIKRMNISNDIFPF